MKTYMLEQEPTNWPEFGKIIVYIAAPFVLIWKFINMYFKERSEQRADFIKVIVKEVLESSIEPLKTQIQRLQEHTDRQYDKLNERIDDLLKK